MKCEICKTEYNNNRSFSQHLKMHKLTSKAYYDKYCKTTGEGFCLLCGKPTAFLNIKDGYRLYCSRKCTDADPNKHLKTKKTFLQKYGVSSMFHIQEYHVRGVKKAHSQSSTIKRINTCLEKYGVDNPWKSNAVKKKIAQTKSKNGTRSKLELYLEQCLIEKGIDFEIEYSTDLYPYNCDFYIPSLDTYIEIHGYWTHNRHIFGTEENDDITLKQWQAKALTSEQYKRAVQVWAVEDVKKYQTAISHNLSYIILWNKQDIDNYIATLN